MDSIVDYIFEAGMLKRVARSGWWAEKVKYPESVAEHSFRTAIVAFALAKMEGMDDDGARRLCTAAVFHDMHEARLGDMHKITARYMPMTKELERKVESDQIRNVPKQLQSAIADALALSEKELVVLKDADYLECAFQAKEYVDIGHKGAESWIKSIESRLKTVSAKKLLAAMKKKDSNDWWKGLKKID
ncbi:HD domain-containing protein [Candidatus Micrarchaeota archaeon]|nr:HD domain-containing protein [Candidatus Micrarchaeota archaeon]